MACEIEHGDDSCIYNVYSLWDGVVDDEESFCDYSHAEDYYMKTMYSIRDMLNRENPDVVEVTVHLYDTVAGEIKREVHVETGNEYAR